MRFFPGAPMWFRIGTAIAIVFLAACFIFGLSWNLYEAISEKHRIQELRRNKEKNADDLQ